MNRKIEDTIRDILEDFIKVPPGVKRNHYHRLYVFDLYPLSLGLGHLTSGMNRVIREKNYKPVKFTPEEESWVMEEFIKFLMENPDEELETEMFRRYSDPIIKALAEKGHDTMDLHDLHIWSMLKYLKPTQRRLLDMTHRITSGAKDLAEGALDGDSSYMFDLYKYENINEYFANNNEPLYYIDSVKISKEERTFRGLMIVWLLTKHNGYDSRYDY